MTDEITKLPDLPAKLTEAINAETPKSEIKHRQARGGQIVRYVTHSYTVKRLNELFGHLWDYQILEQQIGEGQVWVKGQLKIWLSPTFAITKTAFGGTEIKRKFVEGGKGDIIDIGDDLKSASADALKKCASLLGLFSDVYSKVEEKIEPNIMSPDETERKAGY